MDGDQNLENPPQIKGVVIITLPPPDNPSLGKTITAFTLSNSPLQSPSSSPIYQPHQNPNPQSLPLPPPPQATQTPLSYGTHFPNSKRSLLGFLGISLFALFLLTSLYPNATTGVFRLSNSNDGEEENKTKSFVFPLFPKSRIHVMSRNDPEIKLGRFVGFGDQKIAAFIDDGMRKDQQAINLVGSKNEIDASTVLPVRGNVYPDGLYFTYIVVGNPPRRYHLDMDTGSDLTWIQCDAPCTSCGKGANPLYKPKRSKIVPPKDSLCKEVQKTQSQYCETCPQCDYEIEYADHSSSIGVLARDELHLKSANGSLAKLNVVFGCAYDQQGLLLNTLAKTDGILGLSRSRVSVPSQLASLGVIKNVIGHCLSNDAAGGGYLFLGDDFVPNWGVAWIPMLDSTSTNLYQTDIVKVKYGKNILTSAENSEVGKVVFDTGSSYTYFTRQLYVDLLHSLKEVTSKGLILDAADTTLPLCWRAEFPIRSISEVKHIFKTLTLQFGSKWWVFATKFTIPPEGYLVISDKGNVCLGILDGSNVLDGSTSILGDISLRGQLVVYDNVNQKIGWMKSVCLRPQMHKNFFSQLTSV